MRCEWRKAGFVGLALPIQTATLSENPQQQGGGGYGMLNQSQGGTWIGLDKGRFRPQTASFPRTWMPTLVTLSSCLCLHAGGCKAWGFFCLENCYKPRMLFIAAFGGVFVAIQSASGKLLTTSFWLIQRIKGQKNIESWQEVDDCVRSFYAHVLSLLLLTCIGLKITAP